MFEKVNPSHPDKVADRIAGAIVDIAYEVDDNPHVAVEVLLGHGSCFLIVETDVQIPGDKVHKAVQRITNGQIKNVKGRVVPQDKHLHDNQQGIIRCGDNGIFLGMPKTFEELILTNAAGMIYDKYPFDGKYILSNGRVTICQSNAKNEDLKSEYPGCIINPLGEWTGGLDVDAGATNRKLGSDMGRSVTGGGLHGKDLSKADVSVNIYAFLKAQMTGKKVELSCSIGDEYIDGLPYSEIVEMARNYIKGLGGFEKFAEWGLIRP